MLDSAVRDVGDLAPREARFGGRELADPAGADQQHAATLEVAEHLRRERGRRGRDRRRALADRGLGAHALADRERLPEDAVEQRPGRDRLVRVADLAEDLALARDERVEPGGDAEQVLSRSVLVSR